MLRGEGVSPWDTGAVAGGSYLTCLGLLCSGASPHLTLCLIVLLLAVTSWLSGALAAVISFLILSLIVMMMA